MYFRACETPATLYYIGKMYCGCTSVWKVASGAPPLSSIGLRNVPPTRLDVAVSSSPRLWIDVFDLSETFNMEMTESDLEKISITF